MIVCIMCVLAADFCRFYRVSNVPETGTNQPFFRTFAGFLFGIKYAVIISILPLLYEKPLKILGFY